MAALCKCFARSIPPFHAERLLCLPLFTERLRLLYCVLLISCLTAGWKKVKPSCGKCEGPLLLHLPALRVTKTQMKDNSKFLNLFPGQCADKKTLIPYILGRWAREWKPEKALPQTQTKQSHTFLTESVCLCVSLRFVVRVNLCVSFCGLCFKRRGVWETGSGTLAPVMF